MVVHKTKAFAGTELDPGDRFFYEVRNKLWLYGRSRSLNPGEKVLYAGSTVRRWVRTIATLVGPQAAGAGARPWRRGPA